MIKFNQQYRNLLKLGRLVKPLKLELGTSANCMRSNTSVKLLEFYH